MPLENTPVCENCHKPHPEEGVIDFFANLFSTGDWPPRWHCGQWSEFHGWMYILSDVAIWAAYFTIPFLLIRFIIRKKDIPFPKVFWLFGAFIFLCGTTHLVDAIIFYEPVYRLSAFVRFLTAVVSWSTIIALNKILPGAFSLKTPAELERMVHERTDELHKSIGRMRFLADAMPLGVWTAKPDGSTEYVNQSFIKFSGLSGEEMKQFGWAGMVHPDDRERTHKEWMHAVNSGQDLQVEHRFRARDGSYRWHLSRAIAQRDEEANILLWVGTSTDIEDQKREQEKKDEFISIASHELKTPLTSVKAYMQLLEREMKEEQCGPNAVLYVKKTNTHIDRLHNLIADLLDVSKIQAGKMQFNKTKFSFDELVKETVEGVQHTTEQHRIVIEGSTGVEVNADRQRIEQVIINYLTNAIKYSPNADKVMVRVSLEGDEVQLAVRDYGIGIPNEKLGKIFERFFRVEASMHKFSGLGIGLYISCEIIKRHGGRVWVESEEGQGSVFYFRLPVND